MQCLRGCRQSENVWAQKSGLQHPYTVARLVYRYPGSCFRRRYDVVYAAQNRVYAAFSPALRHTAVVVCVAYACKHNSRESANAQLSRRHTALQLLKNRFSGVPILVGCVTRGEGSTRVSAAWYSIAIRQTCKIAT